MAGLTPERVKWWPLAVAVIFFPAVALASQQILIPISPNHAVAGAFGSQWTTDLWVYNGGTAPATLTLRPAIAGQQFVAAPNQSLQLPPLDPVVSGRPAVLEIADGSDVTVQLQVRETTRGDTAGVVIPTVALGSLSGGPKHLLNIPLQAGFRTTLRVYALFSNSTAAGFTVRLFDMDNDGQPLEEHHVVVDAPLPLPPTFIDNSVGFSMVSDFFGSDRQIAHARLDVVADDPTQSLFWAFVSVTNNSTEHVLIVAP